MAKIVHIHSEAGPPSVTEVKQVEVIVTAKPKTRKQNRANKKAARLAAAQAQQSLPKPEVGGSNRTKRRKLQRLKLKLYREAAQHDNAISDIKRSEA